MGSRRLSEDDLRDQIESHYDELVRALEVGQIIPKLRSERLFNRDDEEEVKNQARHKTNADQAGCLVDKVLSRGPRAMQLLIDHVEVRFPALYQEVTGREANPPLTLEVVRQSFRHATMDLSPDLLKELYRVVREKRSVDNQLKNAKLENEDLARNMKALKAHNKRLKKKKEVLEGRGRDRDKVQEDLNKFKEMLIETQTRSTHYQRQAEEAKHHARLATFKLFQYQWELKDCQNKFRLQRSETKRLQQSVKKGAARMIEHETKYSSDRHKVEELQKELEKIENLHSCDSCGGGHSDGNSNELLMGRIKEQLQHAHQTNESLSLRLQRAQDAHDTYKREIVLLRKQLKMVKENMNMNRQYLDMSQEELQFVSKERAEMNKEYNKLHENMSKSIIERDDLQQKLNKARVEVSDLSKKLMDTTGFNDNGTSQRASLVSTGSSSTTSGVSLGNGGDDDHNNDGDDDYDEDSDSEDYEQVALQPISRPRLTRVVSRQSSGNSPHHLISAQSLEEGFEEFGSRDDPESSGATSQRPQSDGIINDYENVVLSKVKDPSGWHHQHLKTSVSLEKGSLDKDDLQEECDSPGYDDEDDDLSSNVIRQDFDFLEQSWQVQRRSRRKDRTIYEDRRRSRSLSRLDEYELDMKLEMQPPSCYRMFNLKDSIKRLPFLPKRKAGRTPHQN